MNEDRTDEPAPLSTYPGPAPVDNSYRPRKSEWGRAPKTVGQDRNVRVRAKILTQQRMLAAWNKPQAEAW